MARLLLGSLLAAVCTAGSAPPPAPAAAPVPAPTSAPAAVPDPPAPPEPAIPSDDACPDAPETVNGYADADGCPDGLPPDLAAILGVVDGLTFALEKDQITPASFPALDRIVDVLTRYPDVALEIAAHDGVRREEYSRCLSCRRADAVRKYLIAHGIEPARLVARGYGVDRPIADHRTEEGRRKNLRVELTLLGPPPPPPGFTCTDRRTLRRADGTTQDCYPYVCRAGACLTRCDAMTDCAGAHTRAEFPAQGWPLECMPGGQCTPMPPDKVR